MPKLHTDRSYEAELDALRAEVIAMASLAEDLIARSVQCLVEGDVEAAKKTIQLDRPINLAEVEIDERCLGLLARRQPMGPDLRFITRTMKMVTDLERIADLAVNLCERAVQLGGLPVAVPPLTDGLWGMADIVRLMVRDATRAFVEDDPALARRVIARDDELDDRYRQLFRTVLDRMMRSPELIEQGIHAQSAAKFLERMGDHATNLAEQVIFMVQGTDVRHEGRLTAV